MGGWVYCHRYDSWHGVGLEDLAANNNRLNRSKGLTSRMGLEYLWRLGSDLDWRLWLAVLEYSQLIGLEVELFDKIYFILCDEC